jgi:hypothetical protein
MANEKHTPGPWHVTVAYSAENVYYLWDEDDNYPKDTSADVMDANARLIAAAPELLSGAIKLVDITRSMITFAEPELRKLLGDAVINSLIKSNIEIVLQIAKAEVE